MRPANEHNLTVLCSAAMAAGDFAAAERFGALLDELCAPPVLTLGAAALSYAELGLYVFPLQAGGKQPWAGSSGFKDATTDLIQVESWWRRRPDSNVGIATGHLVDVIDIDGPLGVLSWGGRPAEDDPEAWPARLGSVCTPRAGGTHIYVAAGGDGNRAGIWPGVDYRGLGGYVVAPPSVNADGVAYHWRRPLQFGLVQP